MRERGAFFVPHPSSFIVPLWSTSAATGKVLRTTSHDTFGPRTRAMYRLLLLALAIVPLLPTPIPALEPNDVFLLVNKNVAASKEVAEHYCEMRKVPKDHVV